MKVVFSQWSAPRAMTFDHRVIFALSALMASQLCPTVELITDSIGARLVDRLRLPFSEVRTALDGFNAPTTAWAAGKLKAYSLQDTPFLHLDQDVFLFQPLPAEVWKSPIVAQNFEGLNMYLRALRTTPAFHVEQFTLHRDKWAAYNAGVLGGTDVAFLRDYADRALHAIRENPEFHPLSMTVYEQAWLARAAADAGKQVTVLLDYPEKAEEIGYSHLMDCKRSGSCMLRVRDRLKRLDPDLYERVSLAGVG